VCCGVVVNYINLVIKIYIVSKGDFTTVACDFFLTNIVTIFLLSFLAIYRMATFVLSYACMNCAYQTLECYQSYSVKLGKTGSRVARDAGPIRLVDITSCDEP
jgi:hypothetical protein